MTVLIAADDPRALALVQARLDEGRAVVVPTDTVYGLAARPDDHRAMDEVFELKAAPPNARWPCSSPRPPRPARSRAASTTGFTRLAERYWPGPLTLVVPRRAGLGYHLGADEATIGLRCPNHRFVRALAAAVGPIATTSANRHGRPTPATAAAVAAELGDVSLVVDGGGLGTVASTVVSLVGSQIEVLRTGAIGGDEVERVALGGAG